MESTDSEGPGYVVLRCKICQHDIARAEYEPHNWTHLEDEVILSPNFNEGVSGFRVTKTWDHEPEPDVIDVGLGAPKAVQIKPARRSNPFY